MPRTKRQDNKQEEKAVKVPEIKPGAKKYYYAVGKRKGAIARVKLYKGKGEFAVNEKDYKEFFPYFEFQDIVMSPLKLTGNEKTFDVLVKVKGGGFRGQAEATRHGITRALIVFDESLKPTLRAVGFVTRDPRVKERKKPGLKRARRAPQWQKR